MKTMKELMELESGPWAENHNKDCGHRWPECGCSEGCPAFAPNEAKCNAYKEANERLRKALPLILGLEGHVGSLEFAARALERRKLKGEPRDVRRTQACLLQILSILDGKEGV